MKVYIMIGLTGSGKSDWARMTAGTDFNTIRIGVDDVRNMIKDRYTFDLQLEPLVRKMGNAMVVQLLLEGKNIVIDDCHLAKEHRQELCALIKGVWPKAEIIYVWIKVGSDVALKRRLLDLRGRTKFEWTQVMNKMISTLDIPVYAECDPGVIEDIIEVNNE